MQHKKISLADTKAFSTFFLDYIAQKETLKPFYHRFPLPENFRDQVAEKSKCFPPEHRETLVAELQKQYEHIKPGPSVANQIAALGDAKTFTVVTGHQLNIFTGPLYFLYKIVTVINACAELKTRYPEFNFVPVYWMASEDHDYEEIKYFRLYGKKYIWETSQTGAVGRFNTKGFEKLLHELPGDVSVFREAYTKNRTLADAVRHYVHTLFGDKGLVVVDADNHNLKKLFTPVMEDDIFRHTTLKLVHETNKGLEARGYETQVFCRDVNFFYMDKGFRERLEKRNDQFHVVDTELQFTGEELKKIIRDEPSKLSPNVILRPLYQEWILPNLAYVGGPAENVYWLQLKSVFDHYRIPFPMLMPRNFAVVIDHTVQRKLDKTGMELDQFFEDKHHLFTQWTRKNSNKDLTVEKEGEAIRAIYRQLKERAESIDKTLGPFIAAEETRAMNALQKLERKMLRAEKRHHSDKLGQIESVKDSLFPNGSLQERVDNFLNFYQRDKAFIDHLIRYFDPFDYQFNVLTYSEE